VIIGGPHVGKTTLAKRLRDECGITNTHHSDDVKHLGWSESSAAVSEWFNESGEWIVEGVQAARALRKWLKANPDAELDADLVILDKPFGDLLKGQQSMAKGVHTVFSEIEDELVERGARVHKLKSPDDVIHIFRGVDEHMPDEKDKEDEKEKDSKEMASLNKRLKKHEGDAMALAAELSAENADLNRQLAAAKGNKPKEGSLVLSPEQAKQWEAFVALGKPEDTIAAYQEYVALGKAEEVKTKLTESADLATENVKLKKAEQLRKVADDGIANKKLVMSVLETGDTRSGGLSYEERDISVTENGKTTTKKAWHVKDGNKWTPLSEYAEANWKDLMPALIAEETPTGTKVIGQVADDKSRGTNIYADIRKKAEEKQKQQQVTAIPLEQRLHMS
jgi:hypothetical protein